MQKIKIMFSLIASFLLLQASAQTTPGGFKKGTVVLSDGSTQTGFIKENLRAGSLNWTSEDGQQKKKYESNDLISFEVEGIHYTSVKDDFFKVIQDGPLCFLQKASDISGKLRYSGSEAMIVAGTEGKPGDYFLYNKNTHDLQLVVSRNFETVTKNVFAGNNAALEKAQSVKSDIPQLKAAVEIYNGGR